MTTRINKYLSEVGYCSRRVADRLIQFSTVIPKDQLMAGSDCGFSTFAGFGKIDENICYEKLHSLVEGTKLANKVI